MTAPGPFTRHAYACEKCKRVTPEKLATWPLACTEGTRKLKEVANQRARRYGWKEAAYD